MKRAVFYHFLKTKAKEEECIRKGQNPHVPEWQMVEKRAGTPNTIENFLFPWEMKYVITTKDLGFSFELSPKHVQQHILKYWAESDISRLVNDREEKRLLIRDMDTNTEHRLSLTCEESGRFTIQGNWNKEFVERRNLKKGMLVGLYWDIYSSSLHFSVLDNIGH